MQSGFRAGDRLHRTQCVYARSIRPVFELLRNKIRDAAYFAFHLSLELIRYFFTLFFLSFLFVTHTLMQLVMNRVCG